MLGLPNKIVKRIVKISKYVSYFCIINLNLILKLNLQLIFLGNIEQ
jgi:hypothetical protein